MASLEDSNPWTLLDRESGPAAAAIPVIIDQATAQWALKVGGVGARFELPVDDGRRLFEIVGLLEPGILQGYLLVSERNFERLFPQASGYAMALIDTGPLADATAAGRAADAITAAWADAGVTVTRTIDRLQSLQAVQNTFLAGFQALGTLGLVLGAAGVAAVQFQSVLERLGGLGLMAAVGFTAARLRLVVVLETLLMVVLGLAVGTLAGCLAVVPCLCQRPRRGAGGLDRLHLGPHARRRGPRGLRGRAAGGPAPARESPRRCGLSRAARPSPFCV